MRVVPVNVCGPGESCPDPSRCAPGRLCVPVGAQAAAQPRQGNGAVEARAPRGCGGCAVGGRAGWPALAALGLVASLALARRRSRAREDAGR